MSKFTLVIVFTYFFSEYLFASTARAEYLNAGYMRHDSSLAAHTDKRIDNVVKRAHELIGTPYRWGGASVSKGFDCSGLLFYLFRSEAGINIPRTT
ncbi:C40 family peptidase, partial [Pseudomonas karstica]|uniref:C40 family peptidase n=1 Tax=Pseudomonas karstica TaxID=1055468 RepID=UPI003CCE2D4A